MKTSRPDFGLGPAAMLQGQPRLSWFIDGNPDAGDWFGQQCI